MRKNKKTIILAKIRSLIRKKAKQYNLCNEIESMGFWSNENYKRAKKVSKKGKRIGNYPYYSKSTKAIEDLAKEIYQETQKLQDEKVKELKFRFSNWDCSHAKIEEKQYIDRAIDDVFASEGKGEEK